VNLGRHLKERILAVSAGTLGIGSGLVLLIAQLHLFLLLFGLAVTGVAKAFGVGGFLGGIIVWALIFWIPLGEYIAFGFLIYGIYMLAKLL